MNNKPLPRAITPERAAMYQAFIDFLQVPRDTKQIGEKFHTVKFTHVIRHLMNQHYVVVAGEYKNENQRIVKKYVAITKKFIVFEANEVELEPFNPLPHARVIRLTDSIRWTRSERKYSARQGSSMGGGEFRVWM